jgi:membrane-bound inhibitor of C-type lysozyme
MASPLGPQTATCLVGTLALLAATGDARGADLTLQLPGNGAFTRTVVHYKCDALGVQLGLPSGPFAVEYINASANSLAILPVSGSSLVFVSVLSASGARYAAQRYIWWEAAGRSISFSAETVSGTLRSTCERENAP